ncbi:hypothetical protein LOK49_LG09G01506 [Camellia lanceoleosa]|uniref:Uncharacterized protein n=1 Tax=Camellia lanceoleosa TaxID=1840588 RepID=A0ACC0GK03_9ERIC|nr:hypothetical protein LOK49_LG09G01506 [Camellia lanceoleosa]
MTRKVLSPLVARRKGHLCMKRKVSKIDAIVNLLKGKNKKANPGRKVRQGEPRKLSFPCTGGVQHYVRYVLPNQPYYCPSMDAIEDSMYVSVSESQPYYLPCMDATQDGIYVPAPVSTIGDDIGRTSHTQAGMIYNISSQSSIVPSNFVDLNIDGDPNVPFFFFSFEVLIVHEFHL